MALDRTNMVSLFDVGTWLGGSTPNIVEMGDGFTELSEDWSPNFQDTQYVNMKNAASSLTSYSLSMSPEREYLSDEFQEAIDTAFKTFPTGKTCESFYYRFYKTDLLSGSGDCIRVPVVAAPSSTGGAGGDILTSSIEIHGNGDAEEGTITVNVEPSTGVTTYTWAKK